MTSPVPRILVVDDDRAVRQVLELHLSRPGYDIALASSAEEALVALADRPVDIVFTDVNMPGMGGLELLRTLKESCPETRVVVMTGYGSVEDAVDAMKAGANDYIIKPVSKESLLLLTERTLQDKALLAELLQLRQEVQEKYGFDNFIGATPAVQEVLDQINAVADTNARVLI